MRLQSIGDLCGWRRSTEEPIGSFIEFIYRAFLFPKLWATRSALSESKRALVGFFGWSTPSTQPSEFLLCQWEQTTAHQSPRNESVGYLGHASYSICHQFTVDCCVGEGRGSATTAVVDQVQALRRGAGTASTTGATPTVNAAAWRNNVRHCHQSLAHCTISNPIIIKV
jgi:hypothetical protein